MKMPVTVKQIKGVNRVVEAETGKIAVNEKSGKPLAGGGNESASNAHRQVGYINDGLKKKAEKDQ